MSYTPGFMVCRKTQTVHLEREAVSAHRAAPLKADRPEAADMRRRAALQPAVTNVPAAARATSILRVSEALPGPQARSALVLNLRGQAYHRGYAAGIGSGVGEIIAILYAGVTQAGVKFGDSAPGEVPNADAIRRGIHKRLQQTSSVKEQAHVDRIKALMGTLSGPVGSSRLYVDHSSPLSLSISLKTGRSR